MTVTTECKFFEVEGVRVEKPEMVGIETWLNLFSALQKKYPNQEVKCGWIYTDGSEMVMHRTPPKHVAAPKVMPRPVKRKNKVVEEPGDSGSSHDAYVATKHLRYGDLL